MCVEKRAFYRAVSGLHASINMHVSAIYPRTVRNGLLTSTVWEPNFDVFKHYFSPEATHGQGPYWLKNLYFTYLLVQRAVAKAAPLLESTVFYTGNAEDDARTTTIVKEIVASLKSVFLFHPSSSIIFTSAGRARRPLTSLCSSTALLTKCMRSKRLSALNSATSP